MLHTYRAIETPEGVELRLRVAGPPARALAWTIDVILRLFGYVVLSLPLLVLGRVGNQYLAARDAARERLCAHGILSLDVVPAQLPVALLNRYLEIQRSQAL